MAGTKSWRHLYSNVERSFDVPVILEAEVIHGFKRGSKELGFPTANLSMADLGEKGSNFETGIYYGIAHLGNKEYKAVISVGWNPFYKNVEKTIEAHLLHVFEDDFYGAKIKVIIYGYLRPEADFGNIGKRVSDTSPSCVKSSNHIVQRAHSIFNMPLQITF
jgi:riboflavin kinase